MFEVARLQTSFSSADGEIEIDCYLPVANGNRFPAVVGLHGSGGGFMSMAEPCRALAARGFAAFVPHYFDRTGVVEISKTNLIRYFPSWMKVLWDAVSHVAAHSQVDASRIGLLGYSLGGYLAVCNASIDPRIQAVVECFGGLPKEMKWFMRRLCPMLILHGEADPVVPVAEAYHLQQVLVDKGIPYEMHIYPQVGHGFIEETWHDASARTLAFLQKYLAPDGK